MTAREDVGRVWAITAPNPLHRDYPRPASRTTMYAASSKGDYIGTYTTRDSAKSFVAADHHHDPRIRWHHVGDDTWVASLADNHCREHPAFDAGNCPSCVTVEDAS